DALAAAPGDAIAISGAADAVALLSDAEKEFFACREIGELLFGDRGVPGCAAAVFAVVGFKPQFVFAVLATALVGQLQVGITRLGVDLLMAQDRHRDHAIIAEQANAADANRRTAGKDAHIFDRKTDGLAVAGREQHVVGIAARRHPD